MKHSLELFRASQCLSEKKYSSNFTMATVEDKAWVTILEL